MRLQSRLAIALGFTALAGGAHAAPLPAWDGTLPTTGNPLTSQQYQDFTIYSLNYLTQLAEKNTDAGDALYGLLEPMSYNVDSSPGKLHDRIVIVTGNTGQVESNLDTCGNTGTNKDPVSGCDNAYPYPSPSDTYFTTTTTAEPSVTVPGEPGQTTWTATAEALRDFLDYSDLVFMFNLNEDNGGLPNTLDGQALLVSAKVDLTDAAGKVLYSFFVGANNAIGLPQTAAQVWALAGAPEADPTNTGTGDEASGTEDDELYNPQLLNTGFPNGFVSLDPRWAYVHGAIGVNGTTGAFIGFGTCGDLKAALLADADPNNNTLADDCETVNQNLGANEVAFAAFNKQLSDLVKDVNSGVAFMNVDLFIAGQSNGFEQLFIMRAGVGDTPPPPPPPVPEPATLALFGAGLLSLAGMRRRKAKDAG